MLDDLLQAHGLRASVRHCQHIYPKGVLQPGLLVEHVDEIFRVRALFELNNDPDPFLGGLVGNIGDIAGLLGLYQIVDVVQEFSDPCPDHGIGDLRDHNLALAPL